MFPIYSKIINTMLITHVVGQVSYSKILSLNWPNKISQYYKSGSSMLSHIAFYLKEFPDLILSPGKII